MKLIDPDELLCKLIVPFSGYNPQILQTVTDAINDTQTIEYTFDEAFKKAVCENRLYCPARPQGERAERALSIIDRLRTDGHINNKEQGTLRRAVLLPETQGEWQESENTLYTGGGYTKCSNCGMKYSWGGYLDVFEFAYCPTCGAKMRPQENEH